jgi:hypothetical protein
MIIVAVQERVVATSITTRVSILFVAAVFFSACTDDQRTSKRFFKRDWPGWENATACKSPKNP